VSCCHYCLDNVHRVKENVKREVLNDNAASASSSFSSSSSNTNNNKQGSSNCNNFVFSKSVTPKQQIKNNKRSLNKIEWKVELLFIEPVMEMKGNSATTSSSSITTSNYPPITMTLNSVNGDVTINEMLSSVLRYQRKKK